MSAECNFTPGNTFTKNPWRTPTNQTGAGLYVRHQQRRHAASAHFPCVKEFGTAHYVCFNALCGLLSGVCVSEGKFTCESSFVFFPWSSPCILTSEGHLQRKWRVTVCIWQSIGTDRTCPALQKATDSSPLAGCRIVYPVSQTQSDVLRRFWFTGVFSCVEIDSWKFIGVLRAISSQMAWLQVINLRAVLSVKTTVFFSWQPPADRLQHTSPFLSDALRHSTEITAHGCNLTAKCRFALNHWSSQ